MAAIGILGGTFDPIHWGHLILAEQACEAFEMERVLFVPAADPPHKSDIRVSDAEHRFEMTRLATQGNSRFACSRAELDRPGKSYTVDTLRQLRRQIGPDHNLYLLIGADEARDLMSWRDPYGIQQLARIAVASRPGLITGEVVGSLPQDIAGSLVVFDIPAVAISSTDLRERVALGRSIRYMTTDTVIDYICSNRLYRRQK